MLFHITVTSYGARWRLKSPAPRLFVQQSLQAQITSRLHVTGLCEGNPPETGRFPHKESETRKRFPFDVIMKEIKQCHIINGRKTRPPMLNCQFSVANLALAGILLTSALGESMPSRHWNMFNVRLCNVATIRYFHLKFGHMHLCGMDYKYFSSRCCKCNSFGCTVAIRCGNACHGPHSSSLYSGGEYSQFKSPRLVKREVGFPNPRRALIGSNQLWRVNDSPYYRELGWLG